MTEQTFHLTGLDPLAPLCRTKSQTVWAAPSWPSDEDLRSGHFTRCRKCARLATPDVETALAEARALELAMTTAYRMGWSEGTGTPPPPEAPEPAMGADLLRRCQKLGRQLGATAASRVRDAQSADHETDARTLGSGP